MARRAQLSKSTLAIGAFVLVDAALIAGLVVQQRHSDAGASSGPLPSYTAPAVTPTAEQSDPAAAGRVLGAAVDENIMWMTDGPSTCGSRQTALRWTTDGGQSWKVQPVNGQVSGLQGGPNGAVLRMVGDDCRTAETKRFDRAGKSGGGRDPEWVVSPTDSKAVVTTNGRQVQPCSGRTVRDIATTSRSEAYVLCDDGEIRRTENGKDFSKEANDADVLAIATVGKDNELYVARSQSCGIGVGALKGAEAAELPCVTQGAAPAGPVDLSAAGDTLWLVMENKWYSGQKGQAEPWRAGDMTTGEGSPSQRG